MAIQFREDLDPHIKNLFVNGRNIHPDTSTIETIELGNGYFKAKARVTDETKNPWGRMHGGVIFVLADNVAGGLAITLGKKAVTLNSTINFVKGVTEGDIFATGEIIHQGRSTLVIEVTIVDEKNEIVAKTSSTMFVIGDLKEEIGDV